MLNGILSFLWAVFIIAISLITMFVLVLCFAKVCAKFMLWVFGPNADKDENENDQHGGSTND